MSDCVWSYICTCDKEGCNCEKYIDVNSDEGKKILSGYTKEVNKAIEPVTNKWKEIFKIFKSEKED